MWINRFLFKLSLRSFSYFGLVTGIVKWFHEYTARDVGMGLVVVGLTAVQYWRDVVRERTYQGCLTWVVTRRSWHLRGYVKFYSLYKNERKPFLSRADFCCCCFFIYFLPSLFCATMKYCNFGGTISGGKVTLRQCFSNLAPRCIVGCAVKEFKSY